MAADRTVLTARDRILRGVREFFWMRGFLEVETPVVLPSPSQEPYLEPLRTTLHDLRGRAHDGFLRMSQEFSLKKMIALLSLPHPPSPPGGEGGNGGERPRTLGQRSGINGQVPGIFELGPVFRDGEPWGETHNPEFTMLEWYEVGADYRKLMETCEELILLLCHSEVTPRNLTRRETGAMGELSPPRQAQGRDDEGKRLMYQNQSINLTPPWERLTMRRAWNRYAHLDLDRLLTRAAMAKACRTKGYTVVKDDTYDDLFFKIHLTEVEPKLGRARPTFLTDWPTQMAGLARKKPRDARYAERVELSIGGLELANGFSELTNADEQLHRFRADQRLRRKLGKPVYPIDMDFIAALRRMPPTAGIALGVDRLVMLLVDAKTIDEVRWLPASALFGEKQ